MGNLCHGGAKSRALRVIVLGPPGVGRAAVCNALSERYGLTYVEIERLLISAAPEWDSNVTEKPRSLMVADEDVWHEMEKRLAEDDCTQDGWVINGFPLNLKQAELFTKAGYVPDVVIVLDAPDQAIQSNLTSRLWDPETDQLHDLFTGGGGTANTSPEPIPAEVQRRLRKRPCDSEDAVKQRIAIFRENIAAVKEHYVERVADIDANRSTEEVVLDVDKVIDSTRVYSESLW